MIPIRDRSKLSTPGRHATLLSDKAHVRLKKLSAESGFSMTDVLEMLIAEAKVEPENTNHRRTKKRKGA